MDITQLLKELHTKVAEDLLAKIKSGEASAQELSAAIKFLKDNSVVAMVEPESTMAQLMAEVDWDEEEHYTRN